MPTNNVSLLNANFKCVQTGSMDTHKNLNSKYTDLVLYTDFIH